MQTHLFNTSDTDPRTITAAAVLLSVPVWMGFIPPYYVFFLKDYVLTLRKLPQIWRCFTTFILTGPKLGMLMDPYFLYTYGSALETTSAAFSAPGDFFMYLLFVAAIILVRCSSFSSPYDFPR